MILMGGDAGKSRCNQHLRSVWNNTLYQAGEKYRGYWLFFLRSRWNFTAISLAIGPVVIMAIVLLAVHKLAILTRAAMLNFGSSFTIDVAGEFLDNEIDTTVITDCFEHPSGQQGDNNQFSHSCNSCSHGTKPVEDSEAAGRDANDATCQYTYYEYEHHVHSGKGCS